MSGTPGRSGRLSRENVWTRDWYLLEPFYGSGRPRNHVKAIHFDPTRKNPGEKCDLRLDVYADRKRAHGELEWRSFYLLKDDILPALDPVPR